MSDEGSSDKPYGDSNQEPLSVEQKSVGNTDKDTSCGEKNGTQSHAKEMHWIQHATFWAQVGLGIVGIIALVIYKGQLNQMQRATGINASTLVETQNLLSTSQSQFDRSMRQIINQNSIQLKAANAAKSAADTSRNALVQVQRAFIFPTPIITPQNNPAGFLISIQFDNSGYTPTRDMTMHVSDRAMTDIPKDFSFPDEWGAGVPHVNPPAYLAPKGHLSIFLPIFFSLDAAKAAIANRKLPTLYMWGWAKYKDVFPGTRGHQTLFCYRFFAIPSPPDAKGVSSAVSLTEESCPVHNCYDDECEEKKQ